MANKRKTTTAIIAGVTAVALLLGGTFAWTSISQQAKNEAAGVVNVGGRLHDDFDGNNKDVYVENFTDPLNGGQPIYARVKLTEYMEVGQDAGGTDDGDGKNEVVPVVENTSIDDVETWKTHIPAEYCNTCETGDTCLIHDHWQWTMGGEGDNDGQTTFMPTFNKDKDSLAADINGTYAGTNPDDKVYYDDYVVYTTDENGGVVNEADKEAFDGEIYSVTGDAYYDDDPNEDENDHENNIGVKVEPETHTAKQTATAKVITMAEWLADPVPGNYWVYDEDGWAYWANPIMPGEATGLLLDGIEMYKNPGEKCYYAINVVGQFATINDWEYFHDENDEFDGTDNAKTLLEIASQNVATVTVTNLDGKTTVDPGETVKFSASASLASEAAALAIGDFEWSVYNKDLTVNTLSTIDENEDGTATLTVGADETSTELIVVAKATDPAYLGALGMSSVAVNVKAFEIEIATTATSSRAYDGYLEPGESYDFSVTLDGEPVEGVTYEMKWVDTENYYDAGDITDATTLVDGVLTVDANETTRNGYDSYFKIIEITAKDADGAVIATRRQLIGVAGFRMERLIFVDEDGNSTDGGYSTELTVGKTYTWYVQIQCASSNEYLNEWLTVEDFGTRIILDGNESYMVATSEWNDELYDHVYTPSDVATFSADHSTITTNTVYTADNLVVRILGPEVTEEYEGETYTYNTFELAQGITIVDSADSSDSSNTSSN